ncbi:CBS domain-containing protein [Clostridium tarantellae]|uniref:CBS domain-containing protein n=1 Tax=Clostridium tarantellae TaxID=39493 RepID=A0A6I1MM78_9CLOT|nr:CBS domain-containing protein [Clostridium tarantellae]MPQ43558.1 CBS domain-containing protein [Clostridium tarantellae]
MIVKTVMVTKENLKIVESNTTLEEAMKIMVDNKFLSIPVVDGDKFKGSISKHDIYKYSFENGCNKEETLTTVKVGQLIYSDVPVINKDEELEKAVALLEKMRIAFVAVIDDFDNFVGILTHKAVFSEFTNAFGLNKGQRIAVRAYDVPGQISKLSKIITENNGDILSFVVLDTKSITQVKEIIIRIKIGNINLIKRKLKEAGFKII